MVTGRPAAGHPAGRWPSVFGMAGDWHGCGYYRMQLPAMALDALGLHVDLRYEAPETLPHDVVIGQRVAQDGITGLWQQWARDGKRLVYEVDDDLWRLHDSNPAKAFYGRPDTQARLEANIRCSTAVVTTTEALAARLRRFNDGVRVIPNYIDQALLHMERPRRSRVTVGWAGSHTHGDDMRVCARSVRKLLARHRLLDLHLIGTDYRRLLGRPDGRFSEWAAPVPNYYRLIDFDIGLAPLADTPFNGCKSPVKALEYAALGIPVVASNVGPYREFVQHGVTGFLADSEADWSRYLRELVNDPGLRKAMGIAARVQAHDWTIQQHADQWAGIITGG